MKKIFIYIFAVFIFALGGVAFAQTSNIQTILSSIQKPKAATFILTANVTGFDTKKQKNVSINITGKGAFDTRDSNNRSTTGNIKIKTNLYQQRYPIIFDLREKKQEMFIKVSGLKDMLGMFGEEYENKWMKFNTDQNIIQKMIDTDTSTKDPLLADRIYTITKELGSKNITGIPANGYEFALNKDGFIAEFMKISQQNNTNTVSESELKNMLKNVESIKGTTWISKRSKFPIQTDIGLYIKTDDGSWYNATIKTNYSRFNIPIIVSVPKTFIDMSKKFDFQSIESIPQNISTPITSSTNSTMDLSKCLKEKNVVWYGTSWCPHCQAQKALFQPSSINENYVECSDTANPGTQKQICTDKNIVGYPTWIFADGSRLEGTQQLSTIAEKAGCGMIVK